MEKTESKGKAKAKPDEERIGNAVPDSDPAKRVNHPAIGNYDPRDNVKNATQQPPADPDDAERDLLD